MASKRVRPKLPRKKGKKAASKRSKGRAQPKRKKVKKKGKEPKSAKSRGIPAGSSQQRRARQALLDYIGRLGKRKAARRLDATVTEIERWLRTSRIPAAIRPEVVGLDISGGGYTYIRGTKLTEALKRLGYQRLTHLTGLSKPRIQEILKRRPTARIKVSRQHLQKIAEKKGWDRVASELGVNPSLLRSTADFPKTDATYRLQDFVSQYGEDLVADYLGIQPRILKKWLADNVPRTWEADLNRIIGRRSDQGVTRDDLAARQRDPKTIQQHIKEALAKAAAWNNTVRGKFRISKATAERWGRLREFDEQFERLKKSYEFAQESAKKKRRPKPEPRPVAPPPPAPRPLFPTEPPEFPVAPKPKPGVPSVEQAVMIAMRDFLGKRTEAFAEGKDSDIRPMDAFGFFSPWKGTYRQGVRFYGKVQEFVILVNLTKLGNEVIKNARTIWNDVSGTGEFMTIRFTFSAMGTGNPFYPGAFEPSKNEFSFFTRVTDIIPEPHLIDRAVRTILSEIWEVAQEIMLFFEHYEIVKSIPIDGKV